MFIAQQYLKGYCRLWYRNLTWHTAKMIWNCPNGCQIRKERILTAKCYWVFFICPKGFSVFQMQSLFSLVPSIIYGFDICGTIIRHFVIVAMLTLFFWYHPGIQKQAQELYGLINYGELRKKIGGCKYL